MTERDQYQQALTHARAGDLQAARKLLLKLNTPEAEKLLARVNARILALQDADEPPAPAAKAKPAPKAKAAAKEKAKPNAAYGCLGLIAIVFVCGTILGGAMNSANVPPSRELSMEFVCRDALQGMPEGTRCDPQSVIQRFPEAVDYCQTQLVIAHEGNINDWYDCLLSKGVGSNMLEFEN